MAKSFFLLSEGGHKKNIWQKQTKQNNRVAMNGFCDTIFSFFTSMSDLIIGSFCTLICLYSNRTKMKLWNAVFGDTAKSFIGQDTVSKLRNKSSSIWGNYCFLLLPVYFQWHKNESRHHKWTHLLEVWARQSIGIEAKGYSNFHSNLFNSA